MSEIPSDEELGAALDPSVPADPLTEEEYPADEIPPEPPAPDACFPVDDFGMPLALNEIPDQERPFFWHDGLYRGFPIAQVPLQAPEHAHLFDGTRWEGRNRSFYVSSPEGTIGLVPFPNSTVVWPHEAGWTQDLHFARLEREARFKRAMEKQMKEKR